MKKSKQLFFLMLILIPEVLGKFKKVIFQKRLEKVQIASQKRKVDNLNRCLDVLSRKFNRGYSHAENRMLDLFKSTLMSERRREQQEKLNSFSTGMLGFKKTPKQSRVANKKVRI